jgi:hypothetical protein
MMITFEIAPEDESEFNDIYDNDHTHEAPAPMTAAQIGSTDHLHRAW